MRILRTDNWLPKILYSCRRVSKKARMCTLRPTKSCQKDYFPGLKEAMMLTTSPMEPNAITGELPQWGGFVGNPTLQLLCRNLVCNRTVAVSAGAPGRHLMLWSRFRLNSCWWCLFLVHSSITKFYIIFCYFSPTHPPSDISRSKMALQFFKLVSYLNNLLPEYSSHCLHSWNFIV